MATTVQDLIDTLLTLSPEERKLPLNESVTITILRNNASFIPWTGPAAPDESIQTISVIRDAPNEEFEEGGW